MKECYRMKRRSGKPREYPPDWDLILDDELPPLKSGEGNTEKGGAKMISGHDLDYSVLLAILNGLRSGCFYSPEVAKRMARSALRPEKDPLAASPREDWRELRERDFRVKYVIFEDCGETDEEIQKYVDDMRVEFAPFSPMYDCTGVWFTSSIRWFRCGAGIGVIHHLAVDI